MTEPARPAFWIGVLAISAAAGALVALLVTRGSDPGATSGDSAAYDVRLAAIESRLERLEENVASAVQPPVHAPVLERERSTPAAPAGDRGDLHTRIAKLEQAERARREALSEKERTRRRLQEATRKHRQRSVADARKRMLDPTASDADKLRAWGTMRSHARQAWTEAIVREAIRIGTTSQEPRLRADAWRQADAGATHPLLKTALLHALQQDPVADVREEAAETLENYTQDPNVRVALQNAAHNDADEGVRRYAQRSLARHVERK